MALSLADIEQHLSKISHLAQRHDSEAAHAAQDDLYTDVLHAIAAMGSTDAAILARAALKAGDIDFGRWCA